MCLDNIRAEAGKISDEQLREALAMAKGMDAANKIREQERGA